MEIAGERPSIESTSGFSICSRNCRAYADRDSTYRLCPSAKMVSNASEDLPDPDTPVMTTNLLRGTTTSMFLRLCSRAPRMTIESMAKEQSNSGRGGGVPVLHGVVRDFETLQLSSVGSRAHAGNLPLSPRRDRSDRVVAPLYPADPSGRGHCAGSAPVLLHGTGAAHRPRVRSDRSAVHVGAAARLRGGEWHRQASHRPGEDPQRHDLRSLHADDSVAGRGARVARARRVAFVESLHAVRHGARREHAVGAVRSTAVHRVDPAAATGAHDLRRHCGPSFRPVHTRL